jgi:hypothetical protein
MSKGMAGSNKGWEGGVILPVQQGGHELMLRLRSTGVHG